MRLTLVQLPKITSTSCTVSSSRAFSANSGQSEAGSTTTASSSHPSRPPLAFCCSTSISMVSFSVVSEIAIVPDSECRTPTLIGQSAACAVTAEAEATRARLAPAPIRAVVSFDIVSVPFEILPQQRSRADVTGDRLHW